MIPSTAHFIWLGSEFPWLNELAVVSAARAGGFRRVVLHLDGEQSRVRALPALARLQSLELRPVDLEALIHSAGVGAPEVRRLYAALSGPAARSDLLRALILAAEGGVYLDMDTVTVRSLEPLRSAHGAFVGQERICFPGWHARRPAPLERIRGYALAGLRLALSATPRGYRWFERVSGWYAAWVNNAVMGSQPGHPWIRAYLGAMLELPLAAAARPYGIGPDLLARVCAAEPSAVAVLSPESFYPLPPVISEHWWRPTRAPELDRVLSPATVVVHWYGSVHRRRLAQRVDADYVRAHQDRQLFARLAARFAEAF